MHYNVNQNYKNPVSFCVLVFFALTIFSPCIVNARTLKIDAEVELITQAESGLPYVCARIDGKVYSGKLNAKRTKFRVYRLLRTVQEKYTKVFKRLTRKLKINGSLPIKQQARLDKVSRLLPKQRRIQCKLAFAALDNPDSNVPDKDGDGISDDSDNCPNNSNPDQADQDNDGIGDVCDVPNDTDNDDLTDSEDNCPFHANTDQVDSDGDAIGDVCDPDSSAFDNIVVVTENTMQTPADTFPRFCNIIDAGLPIVQSIASGVWSNPNIWSNGIIPGTNARVQITKGTTVYYDVNSDTRLDCVEIQAGGALRFKTDLDTSMYVNEIMILPGGALTIGTLVEPVLSNITAQIIYRSDAPVKTGTLSEPGIDPRQLGKGLINAGTLITHGEEKTASRRSAADLHAGQSTVTLESAPLNWKAGDMIFIPDTRQYPSLSSIDYTTAHFEFPIIASVNGNQVTFTEPLSYDHLGARDSDEARSPSVLDSGVKLLPHIVNITRNVVLSSEASNPEALEGEFTSRRGHTMLLARSKNIVQNTWIKSLGRTRALPLASLMSDADGNITRLGTNQIGRYALHFHHNIGPVNPTDTGYQFIFRGNAIYDFEKWGVAVHGSSWGLIENNVAIKGGGAAFVTEDGSERGNIFRSNFAGLITGPIEIVDVNGEEFGLTKIFHEAFAGEGFWFRAAGYENVIEDNVVVNALRTGFQFWGSNAAGNTDNTLRTTSVPLFRGAKRCCNIDVDIIDAMLKSPRQFDRNEVYGYGQRAVDLWNVGNGYDDSEGSEATIMRNLIAWHLSGEGPVLTLYNKNGRNLFDNLQYRGNPDALINQQTIVRHARWNELVVQNSRLEGAHTCFFDRSRAQARDSYLTDSVLRCQRGVYIIPWEQGEPTATILDNVVFQPISGINNFTAIQLLWSVPSNYNKWLHQEIYSLNHNGVQGNNFKIQYTQQSPNFIIPESYTLPDQFNSNGYFPECAELSNQECSDLTGASMKMEVAPCSEMDGDNCEAATQRALDLNISGALLFPAE